MCYSYFRSQLQDLAIEGARLQGLNTYTKKRYEAGIRHDIYLHSKRVIEQHETGGDPEWTWALLEHDSYTGTQFIVVCSRNMDIFTPGVMYVIHIYIGPG